MEPTLTIAPPPRVFMLFAAACAVKNLPLRIVFRNQSYCSSVTSAGDRLKDARVINENVYAAKFPFRRLDQREAGRRFRDIATEDSHAIRLSEPGGCCAQLRFMPAVQQNSGAFGVQALGRLEADT